MPQDSEQVVKVILINKEKQTLLLFRGMKHQDPFTLDLPGGHLQQGESVLDAAVREVKEETNLTLEQSDLKYITKINRTTYYQTSSWEGTIFKPEDLTEHESYVWTPLSRIQHLKGIIVPERHYGALSLLAV